MVGRSSDGSTEGATDQKKYHLCCATWTPTVNWWYFKPWNNRNWNPYVSYIHHLINCQSLIKAALFSLVCEVLYQIGPNEPMTCSRYYKFQVLIGNISVYNVIYSGLKFLQVLKPLDVKTKFYNAEVSMEKIYNLYSKHIDSIVD